jgi:muramidase (phage lysozyme)
MLFGGSLFDSFADHPRKFFKYGNSLTSAAGAFQITATTWDAYKKAAGVKDFAPNSQEKFVVYLLKSVRYYNGVSAYEHLIAGRLTQALQACGKEWASLPTSPYNQPRKTFAFAVQTYKDNGGVVNS